MVAIRGIPPSSLWYLPARDRHTVTELICRGVLSRGQGQAAPESLSGRRFCDRIGLTSWRACRYATARVTQIFAGWIPQDGLFGRSASAGLRRRAWRRGVNPLAAHSSHANHSGRGRLLVFLVRLLWGVDKRDRCGPLGPPKERLFLGPGDSCQCVAEVNMEQAQPSEHERR